MALPVQRNPHRFCIDSGGVSGGSPLWLRVEKDFFGQAGQVTAQRINARVGNELPTLPDSIRRRDNYPDTGGFLEPGITK